MAFYVQMSHLWTGLIVLIILANACQSAPASPSPVQVELREEQANCPDLDSRLFQLTQAAKPLELARQWQLKVKGDKIQVLFILADEEITFLQNFGVEPGTQAGTKIQVFAPIHRLCDLANTPEVQAIRPPTEIFPQ